MCFNFVSGQKEQIFKHLIDTCSDCQLTLVRGANKQECIVHIEHGLMKHEIGCILCIYCILSLTSFH